MPCIFFAQPIVSRRTKFHRGLMMKSLPLSPPLRRSDFVYDLFEHLTPGEASGGGGKAGKGMGRQHTVIKRGGRSSRKRATVSSQFKVQ